MLEDILGRGGLSPDIATAIAKLGCEYLIKPTDRLVQDRIVDPIKEKITRKITKRDRKLSRALKEVNSKARLKNGSLRSGWSQSKIMSTAQKLVRKM